jgi:hypothetical protein
MNFDKAAARTYIVRHFTRTLNSPLKIKDLAAQCYAQFVAENPGAPTCTAQVRISGTAMGPEYLRSVYQAIAAMRRTGEIETPSNGVVCLPRAVTLPPGALPGSIAALGATTPAARRAQEPTPAPSAAAASINGSPRATLEAFLGQIAGDASAWTTAYTLSELAEQVAMLEALRRFVDRAAVILAEESGQ